MNPPRAIHGLRGDGEEAGCDEPSAGSPGGVSAKLAHRCFTAIRGLSSAPAQAACRLPSGTPTDVSWSGVPDAQNA